MKKIIIPLIFGCIVYICLDPNAAVTRLILDGLGIDAVLDSSRQNNIVVLFARCYLCDVLWAYSLTAALLFILNGSRLEKVSAFIIAVLFETTVECLQIPQIIHGTFDIWDIIAEISVSAIIFIIEIRRTNNEQKNR